MRRLILCWGGGCPYIEEREDCYVLSDDTQNIRIQRNGGRIRVFIPKSWAKNVLTFVGGNNLRYRKSKKR